MDKGNLSTRIGDWRRNYEDLLELAKKHASYLGELDEEWSKFPGLTARWAECREAARRADEELRSELGDIRFEELFRIEVRPLALQANELIEQSMSRMQNEMLEVGGNLRNTRDQRKVMNAYYGMDRQNDISYYFDKKK